MEKLKRREIKFGPEFQGVDKKDRVFTCEKHFGAEDVEICKYGSGISYDLHS